MLVKAGGPLGLSIVGGSDHASHPFGISEPGVFISKVARWLSLFSHIYFPCSCVSWFVYLTLCLLVLGDPAWLGVSEWAAGRGQDTGGEHHRPAPRHPPGGC